MVTFHVQRERLHHVLAEVLQALKHQIGVTTSLHAVLIHIVLPHLHRAVLLWVAVVLVEDLEVAVEAASAEADAEVAVEASAEVVGSR